MFHAAKAAAEHMGIDLRRATVAIDGFGNVGSSLAKYLNEFGAKTVAVSDSRGCVYDSNGLDYENLKKTKEATRSVTNYKPGQILSYKDLFELPVDMLIPASVPDVINEENVDRVKARLIVEAANIPITPEGERRLHERGILVVPDIIANAGGVISSYAEYIGENPSCMFEMVERKIVRNTSLVIKEAQEERTSLRDAALKIAKRRVKEAMERKKK